MYKITSQKNKYVYSIPLLVIGVLLLILIILNPSTQNKIVKSHGISISLLNGSLLFISFSFVIYLLEKFQEFELVLDEKAILKIREYKTELNPKAIILLWTENGYVILIKNKTELNLPKLFKIWEIWGNRRNILLLTKLKDFDVIIPPVILTNDEREEINNYCKTHSIEFQIWKDKSPVTEYLL